MGNIDHVGRLANRLRHRAMIHVDSRQGAFRKRRTEKVIGLKLTDRLPQRAQQGRSNLQTGLARQLTVREPQRLELVAADARGRLLLSQAEPSRLLPGPEMMPGPAV